MRPQAIVTDVEGTTSSIRFVKDVLFIYAEQYLPDFVRKNKNERDVARILRRISENTGIPFKNTQGLIAQLQHWMRADEKVTELKTLQGMVWEKGYREGEFQAHVYPDVPDCLRRWREQDINLYVYSSGSEKAQRLFFRYSCFGDLRLLFAAYFDTTLGPKQEVESYRNLARSVGIRTVRVLREEECGRIADEVQSRHPLVRSFKEIDIEAL